MQETVIRPAKPKDLPLLANSWLTSNRYTGLASKAIPNSIYYYHHHKLTTELLKRSMVLVTVDKDDPDFILGWMCAELMDTALVIHFAYVKHAFRGLGVFRQMVEVLQDEFKPPAVMYTHRTKAGGKIGDKHGWVYNPYLIFTKLPDGWEQMEVVAAAVDKEKQYEHREDH